LTELEERKQRKKERRRRSKTTQMTGKELPALPGTSGFLLGPGALAADSEVSAEISQYGNPFGDDWESFRPSFFSTEGLMRASRTSWGKALMMGTVFGAVAFVGWLTDPGPKERKKREYEKTVRDALSRVGMPRDQVAGLPIEQLEQVRMLLLSGCELVCSQLSTEHVLPCFPNPAHYLFLLLSNPCSL
jgi:hypothetical protein